MLKITLNSLNTKKGLFYTVSAIIFLLLNIFLFCSNLFVVFGVLLWFYFAEYFLHYISSYSKETKRDIKYNLVLNYLVSLSAFALIGYDFSRYFVLNDIEFTFENIVEHVPYISLMSYDCAFLGYVLLVLCIANIFNLDRNITKINPLVIIISGISRFFLASFLLLRGLDAFNTELFKYQDIIIIFIFIALIYFLTLLYRQNSFIKFINYLFKIAFLVGFLFLFCFSDEINTLFSYYILVQILGLGLLASIYMNLFKKFKTDSISKLKQIDSRKNRGFTILFLIAILNLSCAPLTPLFFVMFNYFKISFLLAFETAISGFSPYIVLFTLFFIALSGYDLINRVLIETACNNRNNV